MNEWGQKILVERIELFESFSAKQCTVLCTPSQADFTISIKWMEINMNLNDSTFSLQIFKSDQACQQV